MKPLAAARILVCTGILALGFGCGSSDEIPADSTHGKTKEIGQVRVVNLTDQAMKVRIPTHLNDVQVEPKNGTQLSRQSLGEKKVGLGFASSEESSQPIAIEVSKITTLLAVPQGKGFKVLTIQENEYAKPDSPKLIVRLVGESGPNRIELKTGSSVKAISLDTSLDLEKSESTLTAYFGSGREVKVAIPAAEGGSFTVFLYGSPDVATGTCIRNDFVMVGVGESASS